MAREVDSIISWAELFVPDLSAVYIPGVDNWQAVFLSRQHLDPGERSLYPEVFQDLCCRWGAPSVDLLALGFNNKLNRFVSRYRAPPAEAVGPLVG